MMQHKTLLVAVLTLFLFPFCNQTAFGENTPVGKLEKSQGGVSVIREDGKEMKGNFAGTRRNIKGAFMQLKQLRAEIKKDMQ